MSLAPRQPAPPLEVATLDGGTWSLAAQEPSQFTMVVFYRGLHCPICSNYLAQLDAKLPEFHTRGVEVIATSTDGEERARKAKERWHIPDLPLGYGLSLDTARDWGLFVSSARDEKEPERFNEPGLFLIKPDSTLYFAQVQSGPFTRPPLDQLLKAIDFVGENDYPARGDLIAA